MNWKTKKKLVRGFSYLLLKYDKFLSIFSRAFRWAETPYFWRVSSAEYTSTSSLAFDAFFFYFTPMKLFHDLFLQTQLVSGASCLCWIINLIIHIADDDEYV